MAELFQDERLGAESGSYLGCGGGCAGIGIGGGDDDEARALGRGGQTAPEVGHRRLRGSPVEVENARCHYLVLFGSDIGSDIAGHAQALQQIDAIGELAACLLYTSDAADELT